MIERHSYLPAASDDTVIWHYMSLEHFLFLLNRRMLYFSRVDALEDKAEILVSDREKRYWKNELKDDLDSWIAREKQRVFVNCWIKSAHEQSTMWAAYAAGGKGVAIKTTVGELIDCYRGNLHINILDVRYIDHKIQSVQPEGEPINVLRFFSTKRIFYESEQELRLVYWANNLGQSNSLQIPIDINTLVKELRVGPNVEDDVLDMLKIMVRDKGGRFPVTPSELLYP